MDVFTVEHRGRVSVIRIDRPDRRAAGFVNQMGPAGRHEAAAIAMAEGIRACREKRAPRFRGQ